MAVSKIMAMLEKLSVVEKVDSEKSCSVTTDNSDIDETNELQVLGVVQDNCDNIKPYDLVDDMREVVHKEVKNQENMSVNEIYSMNGLENSNINTVFMLGNFINALPENLPYDVKKCSVMNIVEASNTDLSKLLSDGKKRIHVLRQFEADYHCSTSNAIKEYQLEIKRLKELIINYEEQIRAKEIMLDEQNHIIRYETQKISSIINFFEVNGK
jgi:hypothetical protein